MKCLFSVQAAYFNSRRMYRPERKVELTMKEKLINSESHAKRFVLLLNENCVSIYGRREAAK